MNGKTRQKSWYYWLADILLKRGKLINWLLYCLVVNLILQRKSCQISVFSFKCILYRHHSASTVFYCLRLRSGIDFDNGRPRGKEAELSSICNPSSEKPAISDFNSF